MKRFIHSVKNLLFIALIICFVQCKQEENLNENPENLDLSEFAFVPSTPTSSSNTNLVFYGCSYYATSSVQIEQQKISIKKHFNSQLKWPCVLEYDTISLGKLNQGEYLVTLEIIDTNPMVTDTVFHTETKTLQIDP